MNKELLKRWVAALRSGEYKQGAEYLRQYDENGNAVAFCCLGVLQSIEPRIKQMEGSDEELLDPVSLKEFLGVYGNEGFVQAHYALMNDRGVPFSEIADRLEKEWLNNEEDKS